MIRAMDLGHIQPFIPLATALATLATALVPYLFKKSSDVESALPTTLLKKI
jgi:hypothetical protein